MTDSTAFEGTWVAIDSGGREQCWSLEWPRCSIVSLLGALSLVEGAQRFSASRKECLWLVAYGYIRTAMDRAGSGDDISSEVRERWLFDFKLSGDLRFISHRDTMRLFQRALARTALPVRFTEGFNPHPRLTLPYPRPVGIESDAEVLVIDFEGSIDGDDACVVLNGAMPEGIELMDARRLAPGEGVHPVGVRYCLDVSDRPRIEIEAAVKSILDADSIEIIRKNVKDGSSRSVDARSYIIDMNLTGDTIEFELRVVNGGGVKPAEIAALMGYDTAAVNHRIKRMEIHWKPQPLKKVLNK